MLKDWDDLKKRAVEISSETKFMDVIAQVRGGFSEDGAGEEDGFMSLT